MVFVIHVGEVSDDGRQMIDQQSADSLIKVDRHSLIGVQSADKR